MPTFAPINPKDLINSLSLDALCATADSYYRAISDPKHVLTKPFSSLLEGPQELYRLGLLLNGLQLGKGFRVLDFASGSCWLSRMLNQFGCETISIDVSTRALEIGRQLFELQPVVGGCVAAPEFKPFNGRRIDLPDSSVDRIVCFDGFHHVPNQKQVLEEMCRIVREGGIAGFSEPGRNHSQGSQSQYEMSNYDVLENDIVVEDIVRLARESGFTDAYLKPLMDINATVSLQEYLRLLETRTLPDHLIDSSIGAMYSGTVFFLMKGRLQRDSRSHVGLQHRLVVQPSELSATVDSCFTVELDAINTGVARWLATTARDIGAVMIGTHLYNKDFELINLDFCRCRLPEDVEPESVLHTSMQIPSPKERGEYFITFDLVSEAVCWFENVGSQPVTCRLRVN